MLRSGKDYILNRKIGLVPKSKQDLELIKAAFTRTLELSNEIISFLFREALQTNIPMPAILDRFKGTSKLSQKRDIYEFYSLNNLDHSFAHNGTTYNLNKRISRFVLDYAFFSVRNTLLKKHALSNIIDVSTSILSDAKHDARQNLLYHLLSGKPMRYQTKSLTSGNQISLYSLFSQNLMQDIFGKNRKGNEVFSLPYLNNHFLYLRNLLLRQRSINPFFTNKLEDLQKISITDTHKEMYETIIEDFTKTTLKVNDKRTLPPLFEKLLTSFLTSIKRRTVEVAKLKLKLQAQLHHHKANTKKSEELQKKLDRINNYKGIHTITNNLTYSTIQEFKKARDKEIDLIKKSILSEFSKKSPQMSLKDIFESISQDYLQFLLQNPNHKLARLLFAPTFSRIKIQGTTFDDAIAYFKTKLLYKLKEHLGELFYKNSQVYSLCAKELKNVKSSLNILLKKPELKKMSIPFVEKDRYTFDLQQNELELNLIKGAKIKTILKINDKDNRIQKFRDKYSQMGFTVDMRSPLVQLHHNKLILNLPFGLQKAENSTQHYIKDDTVEIGIDLGLKDFAVISAIHHETDTQVREFARYFLTQRNVFDMEFQGNPTTLKRGSFVQRQVLQSRTYQKDGTTHLKYTNIKQKLVTIRKEKRKIQSELSQIKNKYPTTFERKSRYKYLNTIRETLEDRITNSNTEIVHQVSSKVLQIAQSHRACMIKFEDLRWSQHTKKANIGHFIGFWQVHWFFSQVINAVQVQANVLGIDVKLVDARNTSKECAFCKSIKPEAVRTGKSFTCKNNNHMKAINKKKYLVDADLNAARNIAMRRASKKSIVKQLIAST